MSGFLPARRSKWWFVLYFTYAVLLFAFIILSRWLILGRAISTGFLYAAIALSLVSAFIACLFGYLNARVVFFATSAGVLAGILMMAASYIRQSGWEDIIGPILFIELSLLGFAAGVLLEVVCFIFKVTRSKNKNDRERKNKERDTDE